MRIGLEEMKKVQFITFTDAHISTINPQSRMGDYCEDIFKKLEQIRLVGIKLKVDFFIFAGDLFNLKAPMKNSHELVNRLIKTFRKFPAPIFAIEGNHDLQNDNYGTFDRQPIAVLFSSACSFSQIRNISLNINDVSIQIRGFPFSENLEIDKLPKPKEDKDLSICALHLYSSVKGGTLYKNKIYSYKEISDLEDDIFVLGHYHIDQGIERIKIKGKDKIFINLGAISRGVLVEDNISRVPKIGLVKIYKDECNKISYETNAIRLKVKPAEEVFNLKEKKEEKQKSIEVEQFVDKLKTEMVETGDDKDKIESEINKLDFEKDVINKIKYFFQEADLKLKAIK